MRNSFRNGSPSIHSQVSSQTSTGGISFNNSALPEGYYKACSSDGRFCVICHSAKDSTGRWYQRCWHIEDGSVTKDRVEYY